jgi:hypothetical protein
MICAGAEVRAHRPDHGLPFINFVVVAFMIEKSGFRLIDVLSCKGWVNNLIKKLCALF